MTNDGQNFTHAELESVISGLESQTQQAMDVLAHGVRVHAVTETVERQLEQVYGCLTALYAAVLAGVRAQEAEGDIDVVERVRREQLFIQRYTQEVGLVGKLVFDSLNTTG